MMMKSLLLALSFLLQMNTGAQNLADYLRGDLVKLVDINTDMEKMYGICYTSNTSLKDRDCLKKTSPEYRDFFYSFYKSLPKDMQKLAKPRLAKLLAKGLLESSMNPTSVSDMNLKGSAKSYRTYFAHNNSYGVMSKSHKASLNMLDYLLENSGATINHQTNFGLFQLSADRLNGKESWGKNYLKRKAEEIKVVSAKSFVKWCKTTILFKDSEEKLVDYFEKNIKNCEMQATTKEGIKCFGRTVNFCPRMAMELALQQPSSYFQTKNAKPICHSLFE